MKNRQLSGFYNNLYKKGEKEHYTKLLFSKHNIPNAVQEALREVSWKDKKVLDAGCGTGLFAYLIAQKGGIITGVDYSQEAIELASSNYQHENLQFLYSDFHNVKKKYDVIVSLGTLEHTDDPFHSLKLLKGKLRKSGELIVTCPNWLNLGGYILMTLKYLFEAPISLADIHYLTPLDFKQWAKRLKMRLTWRTFDYSLASGEILIADFQRRLPNVFRDMNMSKEKQIEDFIKWLKNNAIKFDHKKDFSGATGLYHFYNSI